MIDPENNWSRPNTVADTVFIAKHQNSEFHSCLLGLLKILKQTPPGGGGGGYSYTIEDMDVHTLTPCKPNMLKNFGPFADKWLNIFENIMSENEFLVVYFYIIEKIS